MKKFITKIVVLLTIVTMVFSVSACNKKDTDDTEVSESVDNEQETPPDEDEDEAVVFDNTELSTADSDEQHQGDDGDSVTESEEITDEQEVNAEKKQPSDEQITVPTSTKEVSGTIHYEEAYKMLGLVNDYRQECGIKPLVWDESLGESAKIRAAEASLCWSHTRPDGTPWYTVSDIVQGENLAKGYATAAEVFDAWLESPDHKENILWDEAKTMYVAYIEAPNGWFWAMELGF